jgi:RHS repeat-associated protein
LYRNYKYDGIGRLTLQTVSRTQGEASETGATVVEVKNYYDDYSCRQELSPLYSIWADSINARQPLLTAARGKLAACLSTTSDGKKCFELYHYDAHGRISYKLSAYDDKWLKAVHTSYNFVGDVVSSLESVYTHVDFPKVLLARRTTRNTYHPGTRLLASTTVTHTDRNGTTSTQTISNPTYDVFGNVTANNRPGTAADMSYSYDTLHGWVKGISSPSGFSEQLLREDATVPLYSGNIGSMQWRNTTNGELHGYDYTYDELGRLTYSVYSSSAMGSEGRFDESVTYNANGSITSLLRNGMRNDGTYGTIDDLSISYDGNRLRKVTDAAEAVNYNGALDFHDGADAEVEYEYDCNGALTKDGNRGITAITYDYGHHAKQISMTMNGVPQHITNDYSPDGRKLSSRHVLNTPTGRGGYHRLSTTDLYVDGLILRKGVPLMWQFDGGYVSLDANGTPTSWNYYVTDHLGSTRKVVDSNNNIKETINYYPFGSEMKMEAPAQMQQTENANHPFRFTGKELDKQNGLNWYDFGARWFDVAGLPMWTSVDPLAEKYYPFSPYAYCAGDPVNKFDPDGREIVDENNKKVTVIQQDGNLSFSKNATKDIIRIANALNLTKTGRSQLDKLIKSDIKVHLSISEETIDNGKSYTYAETIQGNYNKKDNYGTYYKNGNYGIKEASITLYEGSIKESIKQGSQLKHEGLSLEGAIGAVAGHEIVHATNKSEISKDKASEVRGRLRKDREVLPNKIEKEIINEYNNP